MGPRAGEVCARAMDDALAKSTTASVLRAVYVALRLILKQAQAVAHRQISSDDGDRLRISEIFFSIQGESTWAGRPCARAASPGCDLRCSWCDTEYAFTKTHDGGRGDRRCQVLGYGRPGRADRR